MSEVRTENEGFWGVEARAVGGGAVSGLVAGIGMGIILHLGTDLIPVFGAFAGETSVIRGWLVHLVISATYGVLFAFIMAYPWVRTFVVSFDPVEYALAGILYATMIAAFTIALLPFVFELPWVTAASEAPFPAIPGPTSGGLLPAAIFGITHLVYGAILGLVYAVIGEPSA